MKTILWAVGGMMLIAPLLGGCGPGRAVRPPGSTPPPKPGPMTQEQSQDVALEFIKNAPTFAFDGMTETLKLAESKATGEPNAWEFTYSFENRHGGYGDRTGKIVTQAITPHTARVVVKDGVVASATLDGRWDERGQKPLG